MGEREAAVCSALMQRAAHRLLLVLIQRSIFVTLAIRARTVEHLGRRLFLLNLEVAALACCPFHILQIRVWSL
jgi:hypothetical protein